MLTSSPKIQNEYGLRPYSFWQRLAMSLLVLAFTYYQFWTGAFNSHAALYAGLFMAAFVFLPDFYWYGSAENSG